MGGRLRSFRGFAVRSDRYAGDVADDLPIDIDRMDETKFEEFCADLLRELGFVNVDWRKGTGLASSPSDAGRDIVAQLPCVDVGGHQYFETWFVDCKHYKKGIPPDKVSGLLAWAAAERADVALIVASNFLSNPCKDFLKAFEANSRPPFRIRYWERPTLQALIEGRDEFIRRHLRGSVRTWPEIFAANVEVGDRIAYRILHSYFPDPLPDDFREARTELGGLLEKLYGAVSVGPFTDYEWGVLQGRRAALEWVLGDDEWDPKEQPPQTPPT